MANDLFILVKQDRENLANLTRGIAQAGPTTAPDEPMMPPTWPEHQVSAAGQAQQSGQQVIQQPMTCSQHVRLILDTAQDVLTRMKQQQGLKKDQGGSVSGNEAKAHQKDCGFNGPRTCPPKTKSAAASDHPEHRPAI
ncbi:hypothetical protein KI688_012441 [Linnemannia hyalina]|uniref:Uncharacterized protein n=1 Tax=Linnemannia hyalina TaxID=64524 RepID=A0A9P8BSR9_9FUNG|nr:hypothetical protein KI688_012441 [Linnemannia hyalina]